MPFALLQATAGLPEDELRAAIGRLQAAEFLYETTPLPGSRVHLQARPHPRGGLREPAPRPAPPSPRRDRRGHRAPLPRSARSSTSTVWAIMPSGRSSGRRPPPTSGRPGTRRSRARRSGRPSRRTRMRWTAVEHLPETRETQELAIDLRLDVRGPLQALQQVSRLLEGDRAAEAIALTLGDERRLGRVSSGLANTLWITGDHGAAIATASRALDIGVRLGDETIHASAVLRLGAFHYTTGDYDTGGRLPPAGRGADWRRATARAVRPRGARVGDRALLARADSRRAGGVLRSAGGRPRGPGDRPVDGHRGHPPCRPRGGRVRPSPPRGACRGARAAHAGRRGREGGRGPATGRA